jgi:hypothetical protein
VVRITPYEGGKLVMWLELYHTKAGNSSCGWNYTYEVGKLLEAIGIIPYEGGKLVMWLELYHTKAGSSSCGWNYTHEVRKLLSYGWNYSI